MSRYIVSWYAAGVLEIGVEIKPGHIVIGYSDYKFVSSDSWDYSEYMRVIRLRHKLIVNNSLAIPLIYRTVFKQLRGH